MLVRRFPLSLRRFSTLALNVPNPAVLLNDIADRYSTTPRIIMEYVDNSLDNIEGRFRENKGAYPLRTTWKGSEFGYTISVFIDKVHKKVLIRDDCEGMVEEDLVRVVKNVGDSGKKGVAWLNGRFGFGIHAFRAACGKMSVRTSRDGQHVALGLDRNQNSGISSPRVVPHRFFSESGSGTDVLLSDFDSHWLKELSVEGVKREIELHFERLLTRANLKVVVAQADLSEFDNMNVVGDIPTTLELSCQSFDYSATDGKKFTRSIVIPGSDGVSYPIHVNLMITGKHYTGHKPRFFSMDRRISDVSSVASFMKRSMYRQQLWSHPQLIGYIDIGKCPLIEPVITRDEFKSTREREALYTELLSMEEELKAALDRIVEENHARHLDEMESVVSDVLEKVFKKEVLEANASYGL